jgi:hypothetical protein
VEGMKGSGYGFEITILSVGESKSRFPICGSNLMWLLCFLREYAAVRMVILSFCNSNN